MQGGRSLPCDRRLAGVSRLQALAVSLTAQPGERCAIVTNPCIDSQWHVTERLPGSGFRVAARSSRARNRLYIGMEFTRRMRGDPRGGCCRYGQLDEARGERGVVADILETLRVVLQHADRRSLMCRARLSGDIVVRCARWVRPGLCVAADRVSSRDSGDLRRGSDYGGEPGGDDVRRCPCDVLPVRSRGVGAGSGLAIATSSGHRIAPRTRRSRARSPGRCRHPRAFRGSGTPVSATGTSASGSTPSQPSGPVCADKTAIGDDAEAGCRCPANGDAAGQRA